MSIRTTLAWGIVLTTLGLLGLAAVWLFASAVFAPTGADSVSSAGQRIYYTGTDAEGRPIPRALAGSGMPGYGMMAGMACVDCHGEDGRGGGIGMMFGVVEIPDIRYSALTSSRSEDGTTVPAWTDRDIARSIRDGVEPSGQRIQAPMPRFDMTDAELSEVIAYLKELDGR